MSTEYVIDWTLDRSSFQESISNLIKISVREHKVIPLPIKVQPGENFTSLVVSIVSQVKCDSCDARCCKVNPDGSPISTTFQEYNILKRHLGEDRLINSGIRIKGQECIFPIPCPFLHKNKCVIYPFRLFNCILFPVTNPSMDGDGNPLLSLESICPEARRIARQIYMFCWRFYKKLDELKQNR